MSAPATLDSGRVLVTAGRLIRRRPHLLGLGALAIAGSGLGRAGLRLLLRPAGEAAEELLRWLAAGELPLAPLLAPGALLFLFFFFFWLLALWGEGALIAAVGGYRRGQALRLRAALTAGREVLLPFLALDTILFFPSFVVLLLALLLVTGILVALIQGVAQGVPLAGALGGAVLALLACLLPLLCLALPLAALIWLLRTLALRAIALDGMGARASIRQAWHLLRRFPGSVLLLALLLGGAAYVVGLLLGLLWLPLQGALVAPGVRALLAGAQPAPGTLTLPLLLGGLLALLEIAVRAAVHTFASAGWTLAYCEWGRLQGGAGADDLALPAENER